MSARTHVSHESPSPRPHITSKRDLTALCEVEDFETGLVLRTTFAFVDGHHVVWFGQALGVRKYDLTIEVLRECLHKIPDETIYPEMTPGLLTIADDNDVKSHYIKRPKLLCLDSPEETRQLPKLLAEEALVL